MQPMFINSISTLRNLEREIGECVFVIGNKTPGDEGVGVGLWIVKRGTYTTGSDDGTNVIFPDASDGTFAWERVGTLVPADATSAADALKILQVASTGGKMELTATPSFTGSDIVSAADGTGQLTFSDTVTGRGFVQYDHDTDELGLGTSATLQWAVDSNGNLYPLNADNLGKSTNKVNIIWVNMVRAQMLNETIASGTITQTSDAMRLDTEGAAASDTLNTINGGTTGGGNRLRIKSTVDSRDIEVGTAGNILLPTGISTLTITDTTGYVDLEYDSGESKWRVVNYTPGGVTVT